TEINMNSYKILISTLFIAASISGQNISDGVPYLPDPPIDHENTGSNNGSSSSRDDYLLDFEDSSNLGVTYSTNVGWSNTGGGHLYLDYWDDDDYIYFAEPTDVASFQMNAMPYEGYTEGDIGYQDIYAYDESGTTLWSTTVDLTGFTNWNSWLTVTVETAGVKTLHFVAPGNDPHNNGFWPSIDNMDILLNTVPVAASGSSTGNEDTDQSITLTATDTDGSTLVNALDNNGFEDGVEHWEFWPTSSSSWLQSTGDEMYNSTETFTAYEGSSSLKLWGLYSGDSTENNVF
ncbi:uncharacterized protein METZ01_LOCUS391657, partial [marine metagenome]